jgi:hypothetical protein
MMNVSSVSPTASISGLDLGINDLFMLSVAAHEDSGELKLRIDAGFLRKLLDAVLGRPVACGCTVAQILVKIENGESSGDPTFGRIPERAKAVVEFGPGQEPRIRFQAEPPAQVLDGWSRIEFSIEPHHSHRADSETHLARPCGKVRILPVWFDVEWLVEGKAEYSAELNAYRTLVNAKVHAVARRRKCYRPFQF